MVYESSINTNILSQGWSWTRRQCREKSLRNGAEAEGHRTAKKQKKDLLDAMRLCRQAAQPVLLEWEGGEKLEQLLSDGK